MSIFRRLKEIFLASASQAADQMDDPKASLNYSLLKLEESQRKIHASLIEVSAARDRLLNQYEQIGNAMQKYQEQARAATGIGREDLARVALERKYAAQTRLVELEGNITTLENQYESLKNNKIDLERKIALFRSKKEELGAIYDASKAEVQFKEAVAGISNDLNNVGQTIQRAENRILEMRSRSNAIDQLIAEGVITDVLEPEKDNVDRELIQIHRKRLIEEELAQLKQLDKPHDSPKALPMNDPDDRPPEAKE